MLKRFMAMLFTFSILLPLTAQGKTRVHRRVKHTEAYKKPNKLGPHLNIKVTPPEKRGKEGRVLVEIYNFSKQSLSIVDFYLHLKNAWGDVIEAQVTADDIKPGWSGLVWLTIPKSGKIPKITGIRIDRLQTFNTKGKSIKMKFTTDLIKE